MKKKISKRLSMTYVRLSVILLLGLTLLLYACTEIMLENNDERPVSIGAKGKEGNLCFAVNFDFYGEGGEISLRNAAGLEAETVVVPLDDNLIMFATLEPVTGGEVRTRSAALRSFTDNTLLYIVAYRQTADPAVYNYEQHVGYRVEEADLGFTLVRDKTMDPFALTVGGIYKFVAYSYNDATTDPPEIGSMITHIEDIDPAIDLIWGASRDLTLSSGENEIEISLRHLFSKVQLSALCNINDISVIDGVKMHGYTADLDVEKGITTVNTTDLMPFTGFSPLDSDSVSSTRIVYTAEANPTIVTINAVTFDSGKSFNNLTATFAKQLMSGTAYHLKIHFRDIEDLTDNTPPEGFIPYVGAFWKYNQKGERLIRIQRPPNTYADGVWTATVVKGADWIMLDTNPSDDSNVWTSNGPSSSGNNPGFESTYFLSGGSTYVNGIMNASNPEIYFRIGLTNTLNDPDDHNYGVVLLSYANKTKQQRIFIRQGEAPDFLMRPNDAGTGIAGRSNAVMFSPYNLSAPTSYADPTSVVNGSPNNWDSGLAIRGGVLTDYPSQGGYFFSFNQNRQAFAPHTPQTITGWSESSMHGAGNWIGAQTETCPPGYRRPNDGTQGFTGMVAASELRQSLYKDLADESGINGHNSVWGYYADGFFDRRELSGKTTVAGTTRDAAYVGRMFINEYNDASLFFPAAGYRNYAQGELFSKGVQAYIMSSTASPEFKAWNMFAINSVSSLLQLSRSYGLNVRCVKSDFVVTPNPIWLSPSQGNDIKTILISSTGAWTVDADPANASLSPRSGLAGTKIPVTITRSASTFGQSQFTIRNTISGEEEIVTVDNYYIDPNEEFWLTNTLATGNTGEYEVMVYGGSEKFTVANTPSWISSATVLPNGKLQLVADQSSNLELRSDYITLAHADDPTYQVQFPVIQDYYVIAPFDYLAISFNWSLGNDLDVAVEFTGNFMVSGPNVGQPAPFDNNYIAAQVGAPNSKALGYGLHYYVDINGKVGEINTGQDYTDAILKNNLMIWGDDAATGNEGETVFFNAPKITPEDRRNDNSGLPRRIYLDVWAVWFDKSDPDNITEVKIATYVGGDMLRPTPPNWYTPLPGLSNTCFYNVAAGTSSLTNANQVLAPVYEETVNYELNKILPKLGSNQAGAESFRYYYQKVCTIEYDRYTHGCRVIWH